MIVAVACIGQLGYAQTTGNALAGNTTNQVVNDDIIVNADQALNTAFSKYKTFTWASHVQSDNGVYFLNDSVLKNSVKHAVLHELESLGYQATAQNPDLIVNFRVFDKPVEFQVYAGFGETYWDGEEYRDAEDQRTYKLNEGSLVVQLVDRKSGKMV